MATKWGGGQKSRTMIYGRPLKLWLVYSNFVFIWILTTNILGNLLQSFEILYSQANTGVYFIFKWNFSILKPAGRVYIKMKSGREWSKKFWYSCLSAFWTRKCKSRKIQNNFTLFSIWDWLRFWPSKSTKESYWQRSFYLSGMLLG